MTTLIKYLFKYINKGLDRIRVVLRTDNCDTISREPSEKYIDEIKNYLDFRYISPYEAAWRFFEFLFTVKNHQLNDNPFTPQNTVFCGPNQSLKSIIDRFDSKKTTLTEWMHTNGQFEDACLLKYIEFPMKWVWNIKDKMWTRHKIGCSIGRMPYVHPNAKALLFKDVIERCKKCKKL